MYFRHGLSKVITAERTSVSSTSRKTWTKTVVKSGAKKGSAQLFDSVPRRSFMSCAALSFTKVVRADVGNPMEEPTILGLFPARIDAAVGSNTLCEDVEART